MAAPLFDLIASVMEVEPSEIDENSDNTTLEKWDSMRQIMLAMSLESEYGFTLRNEELERLKSVKSVRAILAEHDVSDV